MIEAILSDVCFVILFVNIGNFAEFLLIWVKFLIEHIWKMSRNDLDVCEHFERQLYQ